MATILIVDDRSANREFLATLLGYTGHRLLEASDYQQALRLARVEHPELVITDILMPTMDGYEFVQRLQADPTLAPTVVIFYTATYNPREAQMLALAAGVPYVIVKSAEPEVILKTVDAALDLVGKSILPPPTAMKSGPFIRPSEVLANTLTQKVGELNLVSSRMSALVTLGLDLAAERDPVRLLDLFCGSAREIVGATYAAVGILAEDGRTLQHFVTSGMAAETIARIGAPPTGQGLLGALLGEHRGLRLRDLTTDPRSAGFPPGHPPMRSFLGVPIASSTHVYGRFYLTDKVSADEFSEEDERLALTLATQVAVAYENMRQYDEIQRHAANLQLEVTERQKAQAALAQTTDLLSRAEKLGHTGSWAWDIAADRVMWSDGLYQIFGLTPQEFGATYQAYLDRVHADDRESVRQAIEATYRERKPLEYEAQIVRSDGEVRSLYSRAEVMLNERGEAASLLGIGIDITERKQRERQLEAIAAVSVALRAASTRSEMMPILLEQVMQLLNAGAAALAITDLASGELVVELGKGEMKALAGQRLPAGAGIGGMVIATGQPYITDDATADTHFYPQLNWIDKARATACVPLMTRHQTFGVLWAGRAAPFAVEEVRILGAIADIAGNAIQRATLHEQTEQRLHRLSALRTIDQAITSSLDMRLTLRILLEQVTTQLEVDAAAVLLLDSHTYRLEYAAGRGFRSTAVEHSRSWLGQGYAGRAALERCTIGLPDLSVEEPDLSREAALAGENFRAYYGVPLIAKGQVEGVLEIFHRSPLHPDPDWLNFLEALAGQAAIAIDNIKLFTDLQRSNLQLVIAYDTTIEGWSRALDLRDKETEGHSQRVTEMTLRLSQMMNMGEGELVNVRRGALLHDIGKMGVPDHILLKPGKLTDEEWVIMRKHPVYAHELLSPIAFLRPALDIPYCHHEKWDGTGYPRGLKGEQIPLAARLFAVVDVWDALRSDRPYRQGWPEEKARDHIQALAGTHFDPQAVAIFLRVIAP